MNRLILVALLTLTGGVVAAATPAETRARTADIRAAAAAILNECKTLGGGDWVAWHQQLEDFRVGLRPTVESGMARVAPFKASPTTVQSPLLRVDTAPPMFELPSYAMYPLYMHTADPTSWARNLPAAKAMVAVSQWLKAKGIDLIVVPAPRMIEVYADKIGNGVPANGVASPQLRRLLLSLMESDVEVVDLLPGFLQSRATSAETLYLSADGHWSDRAQQIASGEIAHRLARYDVVKAAMNLPARFTSEASHVSFQGALAEMLTPPQRAEVRAALDATPVTKVTTAAGAPFEEPATSPVVVIGDSFTHYFQLLVAKGSGIDALLSKAINLGVSNVSAAGGTVEPIRDFVRRPELLRGRRVVVWILNNSLLADPADSWQLPPLR